MNTQHGHRVVKKAKTNSEWEDKRAQLNAEWHHYIEKREKYAHKIKINEEKWAYYATEAAIIQIKIDELETENK